MPMLYESIQRPRHNFRRTLAIVALLALFALLGVYLVHAYNSMSLAKVFVPIPTDASNMSAFYVGIVQSRTIYVRFDLVVGSDEEFLSKLCGERYTNIDSQTNPFQDEKLAWWLPNWWLPPQNPETFLGGECYDRTIYKVLIDKTNEIICTA